MLFAMQPRSTYLLLLFGMLIFSVGCDSGPQLGQVTGKVTYQGKPLKKGTIIFEVPGSRSSFGEIEGGQIVNVSTFESGDGVPIGEANVAINSYDDSAPSAQPSSQGNASAPGGASQMVVGKNLLPSRYANPATSNLTVTIAAGDNVIDFDL
ncbi:hypothetical protein ACYFX5_13685 [Bremerella sp. T1]|uniref:hypothetical protein n=1 Tax=Bremerella sp. TYQ1 TaxID=3119568 RepID=UPI001CCF3A96|nr:hypothetical protein [Bremerella volcania]UBM34111.1 hypothetical protein LA756_15625 [Bremerella volcania]